MADLEPKLKAYRLARARLDMHCASEVDGWDDAHERTLEELSKAHSVAMDDLLLTPAKRPADIVRKLELTVAEEAHDNWHTAAAIMALLKDDAHRLLRFLEQK